MNGIVGYIFLFLALVLCVAIFKAQYDVLMERKNKRDQDNGFKKKRGHQSLFSNKTEYK